MFAIEEFGDVISAVPQSYYQYLLLAILLAICGPVLYPRQKQRYVPGVPIVGIEEPGGIKQGRENFCTDAKSMLNQGYQEYKDQSPFYVPSRLGERLMIPTKYVEELKSAPVHEVDFVGTFFEMFEGKYTTMGSRSTLHPRVAKKDLNRHLDDVIPSVKEEIIQSFNACLPECKDWTRLCMAESFVNIVARVSSQMFGGSQLSHNGEWVGSTIKFAMDGFIGAQKIKKIPHILRPVAQYFIPELRKIEAHHATARRVIIPILKERENQPDKPSDFLQWMSDSAIGPEKDKAFIASIQLKLSFAAIHTSAAAPTQLLYDLCAMPQYIAPLREEIEANLPKDGFWTKRSLLQLEKMDSFMKESQRFNPLLLITFERLVTKDYALSDGFVIPKGTTIGVPTQAISMDPDVYEDPEVFDGFRFVKLRDESGLDDARLQYASSNLNNMAFGYGRHACPGRFFASCEIKMIMAYLLMHYDFKFPDEQKIRPPSLTFETQYLPDHTATVLLKRRPDPCQMISKV